MSVEADVLQLADGSRVERLQTLRRLPGKREVFAGKRNAQAVITKVYLDPRRGAVHAGREADGLGAFSRAGILVPRVLFSGQDDAGRPVVVLEQIEQGSALSEAWSAADDLERQSLMQQMMQLLARHHEAGVCQRDLHLGNFVVAEAGIYSLDGDAVQQQARALDESPSLRNLALFCSQFEPQVDTLSLRMAVHYLRARGWAESLATRRLPRLLIRARMQRWRKYRPKLFRECSAIARRDLGRAQAFLVREHVERLENLVADPDSSCPADPELRLKNGNTATVWQTRVDGLSLVIKRYNVKNRLHGAMMMAKESRAAISWRNAHMLLMFGIPTPAPLALVLEQQRPSGRKAYFLAAAVQGPSLSDWVDAHRDHAEALKDQAARVAELFARLRYLRISHGDMKATNLIVAEDDTYLIDLDAMHRHDRECSFARAWERDRRRFLANWQDDPEVLEIFRESLHD